MALPANLSETTQDHLQQLIEESASEGAHLDFKRELPTQWNDKAKHDFVVDVTAFANAGGGDIVYGVCESGGQARVLVPCVQDDWDALIRKLQDYLLNQVEPRVPGVQFQQISLSVGRESGKALIVRVPQSWAGPHRVKTNQHFYIRSGLRNHQLDVPELRDLFLRSTAMGQRIRDFRTERLGRILSGETPVPLAAGPALVVHVVPTQAALGGVQIDVAQYVTPGTLHVPRLGRMMGYSTRINLDGAVLVGHQSDRGECPAYTVLFRNGFVEGVCVLNRRPERERAVLPSRMFEDWVITFLSGVRAEMQRQGVTLELSVMLSLLRARDVELGLDHLFPDYGSEQGKFDRDVVALPDVLTQGEMPPAQALKPVFDILWQAAGCPGSANYHAQGHRL